MCTRLLFSVIQRVYYFVTIKNLNVNDFNAVTMYIEPNITDFNTYISSLAQACYCFPYKANRIYLKAQSNSIDTSSLIRVLSVAWNSVQSSKQSDISGAEKSSLKPGLRTRCFV